MANESHVRFCVYEFGDDPSVVTELTGLEPSKSYSTGEPVPNHPTALRRHGAWELYSPLPLSADVEDHLEALLKLLEANAESVRRAQVKFDAGISCAIYYHGGCNEGFHLSEALVERTAKLGLSLDFDMYFLGDSNPANGEI
jgi:hypothetical protein